MSKNKDKKNQEKQSEIPVIEENTEVQPTAEIKAEKEPYVVRDGHIKSGGSYKMENGKAVLREKPHAGNSTE